LVASGSSLTDVFVVVVVALIGRRELLSIGLRLIKAKAKEILKVPPGWNEKNQDDHKILSSEKKRKG